MIRKADKTDAKQVTPLMLSAMQEVVYKIIGEEDYSKAVSFLEILFKEEENQYSYQNTLVYEEKGEIVGSLVFYDGAKLHRLREKVEQLAIRLYGNDIVLEDETTEKELYIDTISVCQNNKGKGIGSELIRYMQENFKTYDKECLSLLVDINNTRAEKLYKKLGFFEVCKVGLAGGVYKKLYFK